MKLILEPVRKYNDIDKPLEFNSFDDIYNFCLKSFSIIKSLKGFDVFLKENIFNKNDLNIKDYFFLDHSSYVGLFLLFKTEQEILYYVEDTCIGRGEDPIKTVEEAFSYLKDDDVKVYKINSWEGIDQKEWEEFYKESITNLKKKN